MTGRARTQTGLPQSRQNKKTMTAEPLLPEIVPPPPGLMRKRRPIWMWLAFALLLGAFIALVLVVLISD
jgi:hypothetical protein